MCLPDSLPQLKSFPLPGIVSLSQPQPTESLFIFYFILFLFYFCFLRPHLRHMGVPRLEVDSELQLPAHTRATATRDLSHICDLHQSSWQHQSPDPLSKARDPTHILIDTSRIHFCCTARGRPSLSALEDQVPVLQETFIDHHRQKQSCSPLNSWSILLISPFHLPQDGRGLLLWGKYVGFGLMAMINIFWMFTLCEAHAKCFSHLIFTIHTSGHFFLVPFCRGGKSNSWAFVM